MTIKTPEQIASEAAEGYLEDRDIRPEGGDTCLGAFAWELAESPTPYETMLEEFARRVIVIDRAQRDIYELIAEVLDDRAEGFHDDEYPEATERRRRAAEALRHEEGDSTWCDHIGPMIDAIEKDYA